MTSPDETKHLFMCEFTALLVKWNADISADDHYRGYPECGQDIRIEISIPPIYINGELIRAGVDIDLDKGFYPKKGEDEKRSS